jgi:hypothetical protein
MFGDDREVEYWRRTLERQSSPLYTDQLPRPGLLKRVRDATGRLISRSKGKQPEGAAEDEPSAHIWFI